MSIFQGVLDLRYDQKVDVDMTSNFFKKDHETKEGVFFAPRHVFASGPKTAVVFLRIF